MAALAAAGVVGGLILRGLQEAPERVAVTGGPAEVDRQRWAGLSAVLRDPGLSAATTASCLAQVGLGAVSVVVAVLASRQESPAVAVLLLTALPFGAFLGSVGWMWRPSAPDQAPVVVVRGQVAVGIPIAASAVVGQPVVVVLLLGIAGLMLGRSTGALFLTRERRSPPDAVAQVFAVGAGLKLACGAAGAVSAGLVADQDTRLLVLGCGAVAIVAGLVGVLMLATRRGYVAW
jgi:hypothetical protein